MASERESGREKWHWAAKHPLRLAILGLAQGESAPSRSASELKEALENEFEDLEVSQVAYQLTQLQDAELMPRPMQGS